jgi:hypothetical protein
VEALNAKAPTALVTVAGFGTVFASSNTKLVVLPDKLSVKSRSPPV